MSTHWLSRVGLIREGRSEDVSYSVAVQRLALATEIRKYTHNNLWGYRYLILQGFVLIRYRLTRQDCS